jgi:hypothetical protein
MSIKHIVKYLVMIGLNAAFFYYLITWLNQSIQWHNVGTAFQKIPLSVIALSLILNLFALYFYGKRLSYLLNQPLGTGFWISIYGFGANNVLPFRLGDLLKLYYAKKYYHISTTKLVFVKVVEKLFDLSGLLIIGSIAFLAGGFLINQKYLGLLALLLIVAMGGTALGLYALNRHTRLIDIITGHRRLNHFYKKIMEIKNNPDIVPALRMTGYIWILTTLTFYGFFRFALPDASVSYVDALALTFITTLSLGIPSTPGAVGIFEAAIVFYLTKFLRIDTESALAAALLLHLAIAIPQIILMGAAMLKVKIRPLPDHKYHRTE